MLSDEEKNRIIEELKLQKAYAYKFNNPQIKMITGCALNLIEKQSKEIEELKQNIHLKEVYVLKTNDYIKGTNIEDELCNKKWEDKIKAKIEPVLKQLERKMQEEYNKYGNSREYQDMVDAYNFLQSLLEKE